MIPMLMNQTGKISEEPAMDPESSYKKHAGMVFNVCLRVLQNTHQAEDATQAVFAVLLAKQQRFSSEEHLIGWLHKTASHIAQKNLRGGRRRKHHEEEAVNRALMRKAAEEDPQQQAFWDEIRPKLDQAIASLPELYRAPLVLVYLEQERQDEAARILKIPDGTLRWRLSAAIEKLRKKLGVGPRRMAAATLVGLLLRHGAEGTLSSGCWEALGVSCSALTSSHVPLVGMGESKVAEGVLKAWSKAQVATLVLTVGGLGVFGAVVLRQVLNPAAVKREAPAGKDGRSVEKLRQPQPNPAKTMDSEDAENEPRTPPAVARGVPKMELDQPAQPNGGDVVLYSRNRYGNYPLAGYALHLGLRGDSRWVLNRINVLYGNAERENTFKGLRVDEAPVSGAHAGSAGMDGYDPGNRDTLQVCVHGGNLHQILDLGKVDFGALAKPPKILREGKAENRVEVRAGHVYAIRLFDPWQDPLKTPRYYKLKILKHDDNDTVLFRWAPLPENADGPNPDDQF